MIPFLLGFITSFLSSLFPSILTITALKISFEKGRRAANFYSLGVSFIVVFQVVLGVFIVQQIEKYPNVLALLEKVAVFIFLVLAFYFYREFKKEKKEMKALKKRKNNSFIVGVLVSILNIFAILFYFGVSASLKFSGWLNFDNISVLFFAMGSAIGTFTVLFLYGKFAYYVDKKIALITRNINIVLCLLTAFTGVFSLIKQLIFPNL
jgi:threonine/homoserine/homoserine lactone efflux protein